MFREIKNRILLKGSDSIFIKHFTLITRLRSPLHKWFMDKDVVLSLILLSPLTFSIFQTQKALLFHTVI